MVVQIEGRAEALDLVDGAREATVDAVRQGLAGVETEDRAQEDPPHGAAQLGVEGEQVAQAPGERDHPLPLRDLGQDVVHQMRRALGHPAPPARRTEAATLAREGHQEVRAAGEAVEAAEAVGQDAAGEVAAQLALDVQR